MVSKIPKYNDAWYLKERFLSTELQKWIGGGGEKQTIQVGMPRKVRENLSLESKRAWTGCRPSSIRFQKHSCDTNIVTVYLTLETLRRKVLISNNICTSKCVGKLRQIPHNTPPINAAIVILLRYMNISTGWIASDFPSCPLSTSAWPACFLAVWFLVGMVIMGNKFRLVHPLLEWYTHSTYDSDHNFKVVQLSRCRENANLYAAILLLINLIKSFHNNVL